MRNILPRHSIFAVLMFVIMLTVMTALIFTGGSLMVRERSAFRSLSVHSISTLAGVIGTNSTAALAFLDEKVGREILSGLSSEPEIVLGCLYGKDGHFFAGYEAARIPLRCPEQAPAEGQEFVEGNLSYVKKILHDQDDYGTIYLLSNMRDYHQQMATSILLLAGVLLCAGALAFVMALRLQKWVAGPLLKLTQTARMISERGLYVLRAEKSSEIEINTLVTAFNRMLDTIQEREESLRHSEEQFRAAFELAAVGHVLVSPEGRILRVNPEICRILGYSKAELLGRSFAEITHPEDVDLSHGHRLELVTGSSPATVFEKRYLTKGGDLVWAIVSVAPIRNAMGQVKSMITVIQDITQRKKAEQERDRLLVIERRAREEAEKSIQLRDEFLSIASHELRTPLTPIKMHLELMRLQMQGMDTQSLPQGPQLLKAFDISERQVRNLEKRIQDLLDVSRITAGRIVLNRRHVRLQDLVQDILERSSMEIQRSGSAVELKLEGDPEGFWDPMRLEQIFLNLLMNAIKYGNGKPIEITLSAQENWAQLVIRDRGIGIPTEDQSRIFERFERVASIRHYAGLGLGLYITRELVVAHGGTITVESVAGEGSTFTVRLPCGTYQAQ